LYEKYKINFHKISFHDIPFYGFNVIKTTQHVLLENNCIFHHLKERVNFFNYITAHIVESNLYNCCFNPNFICTKDNL